MKHGDQSFAESSLQGIRKGLQAVHDELVIVDGSVRQLLQWRQGSRPINDANPCVFQVVDQSECHGPFTDTELKAWRRKNFDVMFDTVMNELTTCPNGKATVISFGPHAGRRELSTVLGLLQIFAENPGKRMTNQILGRYQGQTLLEKNTLAKYILRIRTHLGDKTPHRLILTDEGVATGCSMTGCAYYSNPDLHWRVIRLIPSIVSPTFPS